MDWKTIEMLANLSRKDKGELLKELVTNFMTETSDSIPLLRELIELKKEHELEMLAHKLKGSGFTIGAQSFAQIAAEIEIKAKNCDFTDLEDHVDQLDQKFIFSKEELKKYLNDLGKTID